MCYLYIDIYIYIIFSSWTKSGSAPPAGLEHLGSKDPPSSAYVAETTSMCSCACPITLAFEGQSNLSIYYVHPGNVFMAIDL
jgi:hypothetical protein